MKQNKMHFKEIERKNRLHTVVGIIFVLAMIILLCNIANATETKRDGLKRAIVWLRVKSKLPIKEKRAKRLAHLFRKYGRMWKVDPWVGVSIAQQESHFRDHPPPVLVKRCKTRIVDGNTVEICRKVWPGDRGMMQIIPRWARSSFMACKGRSWHDPDELEDTETNICVAMHLLAKRRARIQKQMKQKRFFHVRGVPKRRYQRTWKPCSPRQLRFCRSNRGLCKRLWWVASWNWGWHRLFCGGRSRFDTQGYPIKVLRRYKMIVSKFKMVRDGAR